MSKTKIIVIQMKEIIYTALFIGAGIVLIVLLVLLFKPSGDEIEAPETASTAEAIYKAGTYTSQLSLNNTALNLEVIVDQDRIKSVRLVNLDDAVTTMFPLLAPALKEIETQLLEGQDITAVNISDSSRYTQTLLIDAIAALLDKAAIH